MIKRIFYFLPLFVLLSFPGLTYAQVNNRVSNTVRTKLQEKIQVREEKPLKIQEKIQDKIQEKTASKEAKLSQLKQGVVKSYYQSMSSRMWATVERLETLIKRVESRIAVIDSQTDRDLSIIYTDIAKAKSTLVDTKSLLTSSDNMIDNVMNSNNPKEAFNILKLNIFDIKTNLKEVHKLLVHIIGDLEGLRVGSSNKLTPTVTPKAI